MPRHRTAALVGLFAVLAATVVGCRGQKATPPPPPPAKVTVTHPPSVGVRDHWDYNGRLDAVEVVEVRARVKGLLTKRFFQEGADVQGKFTWFGEVFYPGDLLYQIDKREYLTAQAKAKAEVAQAEAQIEKAKADILNWKAQIQLAEAEFNRIDESVRKGVGSKTDLDKARATVDVNKAQLAAADASEKANESAYNSAKAALRTAEIQLGYTDVRAEINGQIGRTVVTEGNLVGQSETTLLTTIVRMDELYAWFDVPERDLIEYMRDAEKYGLPVPPAQTIPLDVRMPGEHTPWHRGKIDYVETAVNPGTGTVRVRGLLPNPRSGPAPLRVFVPGLYVQVRVPRGPFRDQLVLPEDAIMTGQEGRFVYVVNEQEGKSIVEKRLVTLGPVIYRSPPPTPGEVAAGWVLVNPSPAAPKEGATPVPARRPVRSVVAIVSGLKAEDRVIVDGVQKARPGGPVAPESWVLTPPAEKK